MLDAASSADMAAAAGSSSSSILPSATDLEAVTIAAASLEITVRPPLSVGVDITATTVTTAADVADDARYNPAVNVDGGPSSAALVMLTMTVEMMEMVGTTIQTTRH